jgi:hypothetical protein
MGRAAKQIGGINMEWNKDGWMLCRGFGYTGAYHPKSRLAIFRGFFHLRIGFLDERWGKKYENLILAPNTQMMDNILYLHGELRIDG